MIAAIIPARGGSRRLPRKNVKPFCGHPLVAWAITQARCSELIDRVFVTTDDDEIEKISEEYGAEVIRRPNWPDANEVSAHRPIVHAINKIMENYADLDYIVTMLPTCPLQKPEDLDNGIRKFKEIGADTLVQMIPHRETVIYRLTSKNTARLVLFDKKYHYGVAPGGWNITTPQWYINYSLGLISDLDSVLDSPETWPKIESYYIEAEYWQYADTDTEEEFKFGELLMEHYILKGKGIQVYEEYKNQWMERQRLEAQNVKGMSIDELARKYSGNYYQQGV